MTHSIRTDNPRVKTALSALCLMTAALTPTAASAQFRFPGGGVVMCAPPSVDQCASADYQGSQCGHANATRCAQLLAFRDSIRARRGSSIIAAVPDRASFFDRWAPTGADPTSLRRVVVDEAERPTSTTPDIGSYASLRDYLAFWNNGIERRDRFPFLFSSWASNGARVMSCVEVAHETYSDVSEWDTATLGYGDDYRRMYELAYGPSSDSRSMATRHLAAGRFRGRDGASFTAPFVTMPKNMFYVLEMTGLLGAMDRMIGAEYEAEDRAAIAALRTPRPSRRADFTFHQRASAALASMPRLTPATLENETRPTLSRIPSRRSVSVTSGYSDAELDYLRGVQRHLLDLLAELASLPVPRCDTRFGTPSAIPTLPTEGLINPAFQILDTLLGRAGQGATGAAGLDLATSLAGIETGLAAQATLARLGSTPGARLTGLACAQQQARVLDARNAIYREILPTLREGHRWGCFADSEYSPCDWSPGLFVDLSRSLIVDKQEQTYAQCIELLEATDDVLINFRSTPLNFEYWFQRPYTLQVAGYDDAVCEEGAFEPYDYTATASRFLFTFPFAVRRAQSLHVECVYRQAQEIVRSEYPMLVDPGTGALRQPGFDFERRGGEGTRWLGLEWSWGASMEMSGFNADPRAGGEHTCALVPTAHAHFDATARALNMSIPLIHGEVTSSYDEDDESSVLEVMGVMAPHADEFTVATATEVRFEQGASFPILGISIRLTAGIAGRAGAELAVRHQDPSCSETSTGWSGRVQAELVPSVGVDGLASAALDAYIARVGVRGRLELLTTAIPVVVGVEARGADVDHGTMDFNYGASIEVSAFSGRISAFAEVGVCPWCDSAERTIAGWEGIHYGEPLVQETYTMPLDLLRSSF